MAGFNGGSGEPTTFDRLHELLEQQPYRLAHWKTAFDEINYRRFFDVNNLGALRMEDPRVFEASHARVLQLIAHDNVTGLRIDHSDGLLDPASYFVRLERAIAAVRPHGGTTMRRTRAFRSWPRRSWGTGNSSPRSGRSPERPVTASSTRSADCSSMATTRTRSGACTRV